MQRALILALLGSLLIHLLALFGGNIGLLANRQDPLVLQAELRLPPPPAKEPQLSPRPEKPKKKVAPVLPDQQEILSQPAPKVEPAAPPAPPEAEIAEKEAEPPAQPMLPASGAIRFAIYKEALGMPVGRAEHRWEFAEDGRYVLNNVTETTGLAALFKPVRVEAESRGRLLAGGLRPDSYFTRKNGEDNHDRADFDWDNLQVHLERNDSLVPIEPGAQDLLSLTYQLAYLENPEAGSRIGIVTARKFVHYQLESLGEEDIEIPAGRFHTLHLRAVADTTTEIWIALDLQRLPVKIRFTDKSGESFLQFATEIGMYKPRMVTP